MNNPPSLLLMLFESLVHNCYESSPKRYLPKDHVLSTSASSCSGASLTYSCEKSSFLCGEPGKAQAHRDTPRVGGKARKLECFGLRTWHSLREILHSAMRGFPRDPAESPSEARGGRVLWKTHPKALTPRFPAATVSTRTFSTNRGVQLPKGFRMDMDSLADGLSYEVQRRLKYFLRG